MESLHLRKAIFYLTEIVIVKKKGDVTIHIDDISSIIYEKPKIWNYLPFFNIGCTPKLMRIFLNREIDAKKLYCLVVDYKDVLKIQGFFQKDIMCI